MMNSKTRKHEKCAKCKAPFTYLPRTDGKQQRICCYRCEPRKR